MGEASFGEGEAPAEPQDFGVTSGSAGASPSPFPNRTRPADGAYFARPSGTIIFATVCTKDRVRCLASDDVHRLLINVWHDAAAWLVGRYVIMPDHIHLFSSPNQESIGFDAWVKYWKSQFTRRFRGSPFRWLPRQWDTRMRCVETYEQKWDYVKRNPVRHGLTATSDEWPYQGELNILHF